MMVVKETEQAHDLVQFGKIKWFNSSKGFGFVTCPEVEQDILLHKNVLGRFGGRALPQGSEIRFICKTDEKGPRVIEVIEIDLELTQDDVSNPPELQEIPLVPARIKWFDDHKGFGFANSFRNPQDIFVHSNIVHRFGSWSLSPGEAVSLRVGEGEHGLIALDIRPWSDLK